MTDMTLSATNGQAAQTKAAAVKKNTSRTGRTDIGQTGFAPRGLYDPRNEHDACGVGFIVNMKGVKSHQIVKDGLAVLENLTHRGAVGADPLMGDGAGDPDPDSRRVLPRRDGSPGHRTAAARRVWRRALVHAAGHRAARPYRGHHRRIGAVRGAAAARIPRRARRQFVAVEGARHRGVGAVPPPGLHRPHGRTFIDDEEYEAPALSAAQGHLRPHLCRERQQGYRCLLRVAVGPHHRLQGHVPGLPGWRLLQGPQGPALRHRVDPRPPAFLDQHLPVVEAGASLPHGRAQWRDQHRARQQQLDGGQTGVGRFRTVRQQHLEALADLL